MKIAIIINSDVGAGQTIGARAFPIIQELQRSGLHTVTIFARGATAEAARSATIVYPVPGGRFLMRALTAIQIYTKAHHRLNTLKTRIFEFWVLRYFRRHKTPNNIDVVMLFDFLPRTVQAIHQSNPRVRIIQDVPIALPTVYELLDDPGRFFSSQERGVPEYIQQALPFIHEYIVPSEITKKSLRRAGVQNTPIHIVPFGVDSKKFQPLPKKPPTPFCVAFAGNINFRKGISYVLDAWEQLSLPDVELHLYGRLYPEVQQRVHNAAASVIHHGFVPLSKELPKNHLYVFPSLQEGSAKSVYEALACGLPVITTEHAGSIVRDGIDGRIIPIQDSSAIVAAIQELYYNRQRVDAMSRAARQRAQEYTWQRYAKGVVAVLTQQQ